MKHPVMEEHVRDSLHFINKLIIEFEFKQTAEEEGQQKIITAIRKLRVIKNLLEYAYEISEPL